MKSIKILLALVLTFAAALAPALAPATDHTEESSGEVTVPLSRYTSMLTQLTHQPRQTPAAYAIGQSEVIVTVSENEGRFTATAEVSVQIETFDSEWTLVPVLPPGAALRHASVGDQPVQLVERPDGLAWNTEREGTVSMRLVYDVNATRHESGFVLPLITPRASATTFKLVFPGNGVDMAVMPSADLRVSERAGQTLVSATIPATSSIIVSWRAPGVRPFAIGRADYNGELRDGALVWSATFQVELFTGQRITLPVLPNSVTLNDIRVDGEPAMVLDHDGHFVTSLAGRGRHEVVVEFQVPESHADGPPQASFRIPRVPVSRFALSLPGRKEVKVLPQTSVLTEHSESTTLATAFIPMSDTVTFTWSEAVPEDLREQARANASLYHRIHAEEGVLHVLATIVYEITHGETEGLQLGIPANAQVNRIVAPKGGVSDWVVVDGDTGAGVDATGADEGKTIQVFLQRPVSGQFVLEVSYELLLGAAAGSNASIDVPLLSASGMQRQRGMVALLSGPELTLEPVSEAGLSRVGENQLPAFIRDRIGMTVAHTYKYTESRPELSVAAVAPERKQGQFDAQIDTLVSLGDVTMKGSATVGVDVKSGSLLELALRVPSEVNVLGVSGPSLRNHQIRAGENAQIIDMAFTREMEGQFRVEVIYERIMDAQAPDVVVPTIAVVGAEVEHGRIAVEALTAVEVRATTSDQLSSLDINELPRQLVLKTTNPILLAYRYVQTKMPSKLALKITRHEEIDVQVAVIERADYGSLFTSDGLAVTSARLLVRNSRRQFLRLSLPEGSEVWSVFVDGRPEKPAYANGEHENGSNEVLIKMINSANGFPVDIVYATRVGGMGRVGTVSSRLPRPDMVVTRTRWDVFLPVGPRYFRPETSMHRVAATSLAARPAASMQAVARASDAVQAQMGQPLRISVPTQGVRYAFEELYANQSDQHAAFSIRYVSANTNLIGRVMSGAGVLALCVGVFAMTRRSGKLARAAAIAVNLSGAALLAGSIGYLGTDPVLALGLVAIATLSLGAWWVVGRVRRRAA